LPTEHLGAVHVSPRVGDRRRHPYIEWVRVKGSTPLFLLLASAIAAAAAGGTILGSGRDTLSAARLPEIPAYLSPPPLYTERGLDRPWRVGIQAGHWDISDLPDEQAHLRTDTGASYGRLQEVDVNLAIARDIARDLSLAGVTVDLLPARVPAGYDADAFVAIHADGGSPQARGFKVSVPWRASEASLLLQDAIERAYGSLSGIPMDRYGVTYNMRGYYAFSWYRFSHAVAPSTPCAIIETGYITSRADRAVIVDDPQAAARAITAGIILYLSKRPTLKTDALVARAYPPMIVAAGQAALRFLPGDDERVAAVLPSGTVVHPLQMENGWVDLMQWGNFRVFGWMKLADLQPAVGG
jgi:N-acetylmuramoyl-L-alanine amidase